MNIRTDIAELLHAGTPQIHICRQLHVAPITVQRTREALGLPAPKTVRVLPASLDDAFRQYARPTPDGHAAWAGPVNNGTPKLTFNGVVYYARPLAFRLRYGREPVGNVTSDCPVKHCVAGDCIKDRPMREQEQQLDRLYAGIFGEVAA
jgi:hypothetical protein